MSMPKPSPKEMEILLQKHSSTVVPILNFTYFNSNLALQGRILLLIWIYMCSSWMTCYVSFQSSREPTAMHGAFRAETHLPVLWELCSGNAKEQPPMLSIAASLKTIPKLLLPKLHPWRYSKATWMWFWATSCR